VNDGLHDLKWNAIAYAIVAGVSVIALVVMWFLVPALSERWLPIQRLRPGSWTGQEVFISICATFGFPLLIVQGLIAVGFFLPLIGPSPDLERMTPELREYVQRCAVISSPLSLTVILAFLFYLLYIRIGDRPHQYGLTWARWPNNVALGLAVFVPVTPIVLGIFALLTFLLPSTIHQMVAQGRHDPPFWEWTLMGFQATIAAPILEEVLVRGILLGWLRRASLVGHVVLVASSVFLVGHDVVPFNLDSGRFEVNYEKVLPSFFAVTLAFGYAYWMHKLKRDFDLDEMETQDWMLEPSPEPSERDEARQYKWSHANSYLAIYGSAMWFAVIHPWPAPVPLFLFGLVLGWIAYRTQSLVGPITLHVALNLLSFIALYGSVATR